MTELDLKADAARTLDVIEKGGVAIIPLDVAYAIVGHSADSIRRIFSAKNRSFEKPSGMFSNWQLFNEIHITGERERDIVDAVINKHNLPFSVVAPFRQDHPMIAGIDPFVIQNSTKAGTLDMLLNAGDLHNEMTRLSIERQMAVVGSSANTSLTGSKFRLNEVDAPVLEAADIKVDGGLCKYHNPDGRSSTIIDLKDFKTIRVGVCYDAICDVFREGFDIDLKAIMAA